jgi:homogentisate phytyltransferase/homogentisate geranylgeranyltransferase
MAHSFVENWSELVLLLWKQASVFRRAAVMTRPLWFITGFMCFFSIVIALSKDIPDVEGDRVFGIRSFSVRMGKKRVSFCKCTSAVTSL